MEVLAGIEIEASVAAGIGDGVSAAGVEVGADITGFGIVISGAEGVRGGVTGGTAGISGDVGMADGAAGGVGAVSIAGATGVVIDAPISGVATGEEASGIWDEVISGVFG